jgi:hypothetical protein
VCPFDLAGPQHLSVRRVIVIAQSRLSSRGPVSVDLGGQEERTHVEWGQPVDPFDACRVRGSDRDTGWRATASEDGQAKESSYDHSRES